jgi:hypothetical protein
MSENPEALRRLLKEEVERIVEEARRKSVIVRAGYHAGMLAMTVLGVHFSVGRLVDEIVLAAAKKGVPVEMSRPAE